MENCKNCCSNNLKYVKYIIANGRINIRKTLFNTKLTNDINLCGCQN